MGSTLFAILAGVLVSVFGFLPLAIRRPPAGIFVGVVEAILWPILFYVGMPSMAYPMLGWVGGAVIFNLVLGAIIASIAASDARNTTSKDYTVPWVPAIIAVLLLIIVGASGASCFRAKSYAGMIGEVKEHVWAADMQPIDPKRIALVPYETAVFLADKELGEAEEGAIGSQYHLDKDYMTLQRVNQHLWWVVPLDYDGFLVWWNSNGSPGYVMVDAENPRAKPKLVLSHKFKYTPGAYFGDELKRYIWSHGYASKVLTDFSFEIDEDGKPWWVVTAYEPTIAYSGPKVLGVALVNPETGDISFQPVGKVDPWIDRVYPSWVVKDYVNWWGQYWDGWINSWSAKVNLRKVSDGPVIESKTKPGQNKNNTETHHGDDIWVVYGSDGEPYWFVGVTSSSDKDGALVGTIYMNARTGQVRYYKMSGQSESKIASIIYNKVKFQNLSPSRLYLFNVSGRVVWFSTLVGQAGTFNAVALVDSETSELFDGSDEATAFRLFTAKNWQGADKIDPSADAVKETVMAKVTRIGCPVIEGQTVCYLLLANGMLVTGSGALAPRLSMTRDGDEITATFIRSGDYPANPHGLVSVVNPALEAPFEQAPEQNTECGHGVEVSF